MKFQNLKKVTVLLLFSLNTFAQISKVEIVATGLTCSMCSNAINKQLKKIPNIDKIEVDLNTNTFTISLNKDNNITPNNLKESIQKAGFFVGSMIITINDKDLSENYIILSNEKSSKYKVLDKTYLTMSEFKKFRKLYSNISSYLIDNESDYHLFAVK